MFKILVENDCVVHDLKLFGVSGVDHQIDVIVESEGKTKRTLIECKDYSSNIDLGIVKQFWGAVEDLRPDVAIILTCVGYSDRARKFAEAKGIIPAILRVPESEDAIIEKLPRPAQSRLPGHCRPRRRRAHHPLRRAAFPASECLHLHG